MDTIDSLKRDLYNKQQQMQQMQDNLSKIQEQNSALEQDFETKINMKNEKSKELGMMIKAINNIYSTCMMQTKRGRLEKEKDCREGDVNLVEQLVQRLGSSKEVIEDLQKIAELEDKFEQIRREKEGQTYG